MGVDTERIVKEGQAFASKRAKVITDSIDRMASTANQGHLNGDEELEE